MKNKDKMLLILAREAKPLNFESLKCMVCKKKVAVLRFKIVWELTILNLCVCESCTYRTDKYILNKIKQNKI